MRATTRRCLIARSHEPSSPLHAFFVLRSILRVLTYTGTEMRLEQVTLGGAQ